METKNKFATLLVFLTAFGIFLVAKQRFIPRMNEPEPAASTSPAPDSSPLVSMASLPGKLSVATTHESVTVRAETTWEEFRSRFGHDLQPKYLSDGRLASIRAGGEESRMVSEGFKADDPQSAISRAKEVVRAAARLLKIQDDQPLELPIYRSVPGAAQVYLRETIQGVPLAPVGTVTVDLGSHGELVGLYSEYVPSVHVTNSVQLSPDQAKHQALAATPDQQIAMRPEGGNPVIWVLSAGRSTGSPEGRHAYEFVVQGHQIVVDAQTGGILFKKDRRQF